MDEFAINKGHTYATCVLDIERGYVLWVGKGRNIESFMRFFIDTEPDLLSEVKAVAMDMIVQPTCRREPSARKDSI